MPLEKCPENSDYFDRWRQWMRDEMAKQKSFTAMQEFYDWFDDQNVDVHIAIFSLAHDWFDRGQKHPSAEGKP